MNKKLIVAILLIYISTFSIKAQGIFETIDSTINKIEFNGFVRASTYGATQLFDYSSVFSEFALQPKLTQGKTYLYTDLRFRTGFNFNEQYSTFELKEAYAGYQSPKFDVFLGNQIITWGRTDGFNPTNNITPNDYFFLSPNLDDQKKSNFMLRTKLRFTTNIDIEIIAIPIYKPSNYRYELFETGNNINYTDVILPDKAFKNASFATRLNFDFSKIGFSASYFRGFDTFYGFNVKSIDFINGLFVINNEPKPYLKTTVGGDFSLPLKSFIIRGEAAYNITEDYAELMYTPNPNVSYTTALESSFGDATIIFQYIGKYNFDFTVLEEPILTNIQSPLAHKQYAEEMIFYESTLFNRKIFYQQEKTNHAISLSINKNFAYNTWSAELSGYYNLTSEELMIRPQIGWKISDMLMLKIGGAYMTGKDETIFNYSAPILSGIFASLKASF